MCKVIIKIVSNGEYAKPVRTAQLLELVLSIVGEDSC